MALLSEKDAAAVRQQFADTLISPVKLVVFTQEFECAFCRETRQIVEEVAALSPYLSADVRDFVADKDMAAQLGVDKIPAIAVLRAGDGAEADTDYGIRFYGIPSGYEFISLLEAIKLVGSGKMALSRATLDKLAGLTQPLHLQVFVTPTCPYCPRAVVLAHQLAFANAKITADMVEATEFPYLAARYQVMGVPRTVINETIHIEGAVPESMLVAKLPLN